jgi:hypothetical protein
VAEHDDDRIESRRERRLRGAADEGLSVERQEQLVAAEPFRRSGRQDDPRDAGASVSAQNRLRNRRGRPPRADRDDDRRLPPGYRGVASKEP